MNAGMQGERESSPEAGWNWSAGYGLAMLTLISAFNYLDRSLLGLALPAIKREMHVSDTMLGLVSGVAFLLFYSILGVPIASLAERWNRRNIIAMGLAFWSLMTACTAWVGNIAQLALARFLMGAGEACGTPPSISMIATLFPERRRPLAMSIFGTAVSVSSILFFPLMGWIGQKWGWRSMFLVAGAPGIALSLLFFLTVREPVPSDRAVQERQRPPFFASIGILLRSRTYLLLLAAAALMGFNVFSASVWIPTFLDRVHGIRMAEAAAIIGPLKGGFGVAGTLLGGLLVDRLARRNRRWIAGIAALSCFLLVPVDLVLLMANERSFWIPAFAASAALMIVHQGPLFALVTAAVPRHMRAVAISIVLLVSALIGQTSGPLIVGILNDHLGASLGTQAIRWSLLTLLVTAFCAGLALLGAVPRLQESGAGDGERPDVV